MTKIITITHGPTTYRIPATPRNLAVLAKMSVGSLDRPKFYTRESASLIVELFEDLLRDKNIVIPCADPAESQTRFDLRSQDKLYGAEKQELLDCVENIIIDAVCDVRAGMEIIHGRLP